MAEDEIPEKQEEQAPSEETVPFEEAKGEVVETPEEAPAEGEEKPAEDEEEKKKKERKIFNFESNRYVSKKVKSLVFGLMSPKIIKKMAAAKVVTPELYDKEGYPVDGGLIDIRLGVIDPGLKCRTCGSKLKDCIGHFGYIELARPIIHVKFARHILRMLRCSCWECGRILLSEAKINALKTQLDEVKEKYGFEAWREFSDSMRKKIKQSKKCPHCGQVQKKIVIEKPSTFFEEDKRISPIEVRARLEKISDVDCELFGLNPEVARPEWMVLTIMAIPPVTMRPSITLETGERSEDDLTHKMGDIVRINQRLFENINAGAPEIIIEDLWDLLQYHVTTFFDNNIAQIPPSRHRSGQPLKTITERIKSKEGRIRYNLAGKRVNFCARSVISPDSMLKINEIGVPRIVATKLTIPERVTEWNMEYLKKFIENGPTKYPGCNYIVRPDGKKKKITDETKEMSLEEIQPGYIVERHLMDGDIAVFNRQPSLHRLSMMCHRIKVLPYRTLRLNPAVCKPYNADFDGDEMNLHIPQTEEGRAEAEVLMEVQRQLISPGYGLSVMGCIQDAISGNFLLTKYLQIPRKEAIMILASIGVEDFSRLPEGKLISGRDVFSVIIPKDFSFNGTSKSGEKVIVKKGKLVEGVMDDANLGGGSGIMLRRLHKEYGADAMVDILHNFLQLGIEVLYRYGFTTVISDTDLPDKAKEMIEKTLQEAEISVNEIIEKFYKGELEPYPSRTIEETVELMTLEALNKARNACGAIVQEHANKNTHTIIMAESGARGNPLNLAQMAAVVGQQALRGKRIDKGYASRTLSCFKRGDLSPEAKGFIRNGFKHGLSPKEFFFGAMTGRDSLMDTALRTPKSGYLYRRLSNALQDLKVEYDGTVRDVSNKIVQFMYGEDGIDVAKSEKGKLNIKKIIEEVK